MIRLVRADADLLDAAIAGDHALAKALGQDAIPGWATFTEALRSTRAALAEGARDPRWGTRLFVAGERPELVGCGGLGSGQRPPGHR